MEQAVACFWRAFSLDESEQAADILADIQIALSRSLVPGAPIILSEGQCRRVVIGYDLDDQVGTIHYLVKDSRIRFLSVAMATSPALSAHMEQQLQSRFSKGMPLLPEEFDCFIYASGWRDLVTRGTDAVLVRDSLNPWPRTRPVIGGVANQ